MNKYLIDIRVEHVSKKLGPNQALDDVSMRFGSGKIHGLIGPEGAGKTTLIRNILELLHPDKGEIGYRQNGENTAFSDIRQRIAYMPQQQSLYADLSVSEHLDFFSSLYGISGEKYRAKREELLRMTRMQPFVERPAGKLSGGMYKKLGLMCALLRSPAVVILDEPTNGVDPISRREFWELIYELSAQDILIIMATAYMDEAERCSEVHLIEAGKRLAEGEPRTLLKEEAVENFDAFFIKRQEAAHAQR